MRRQKTSDFSDFPDIWSLFSVYFYAGCLEAEKKHTWVQYFQYFSSFLYFSHTHLFWGFKLFNSYWCRTFEKKVTFIWIIYCWLYVEVQYICIKSYISRGVRFHFRLVFVGLVLKSPCIGPKSNLHGDFKSHPKTDDVKTKKKLWALGFGVSRRFFSANGRYRTFTDNWVSPWLSRHSFSQYSPTGGLYAIRCTGGEIRFLLFAKGFLSVVSRIVFSDLSPIAK